MSSKTTFFKYSLPIIKDKNMLSSLKNTQHGTVSVFTHCIMVAKYSYLLNEIFDLKCDAKALIRGALLHDFFLYDWHNIPKEVARDGLHGFKHPIIAAKNARCEFDISPKEYGIITCHMWPLTFTRVPFNRESWIVCCVDKYCSLMETLGIQPYSNYKVKLWVERNVKRLQNSERVKRAGKQTALV